MLFYEYSYGYYDRMEFTQELSELPSETISMYRMFFLDIPDIICLSSYFFLDNLR